MQSAALFFLRYVLIAAAIAGAVYSGILARAGYLFHLDTASSLPSAVHLVPYNAEYVSRLASWEPERRDELLHRAVSLDPFDYQSWIQLGIFAEMREADPKTAERYFLQAAAVDHMFLPKWTLANFYFRRQNPSEFFHWANETLKITPYAADPVFTQMWLMSQDSGRIAAAVPNRSQTLLQYAWFLSNSHQNAAIPPIVQRLVTTIGSTANPRSWGRDDLIASTEDNLLAAGDLPDALQVWTTLRDAGWIAQSVPDFNRPLTNGDFRIPFLKRGFDWRPDESNGVKVEQTPASGQVILTLSGDEAEHCVLLQQYVPLDRAASYRLTWTAEGRNIDPGAGFAWHLNPVKGPISPGLVSGDLLASPNSWNFEIPVAAQVFLLSLEYTRPLGRTQPSGSVALSGVSLHLIKMVSHSFSGSQVLLQHN